VIPAAAPFTAQRSRTRRFWRKGVLQGETRSLATTTRAHRGRSGAGTGGDRGEGAGQAGKEGKGGEGEVESAGRGGEVGQGFAAWGRGECDGECVRGSYEADLRLPPVLALGIGCRARKGWQDDQGAVGRTCRGLVHLVC